jgi:hypothetical protein
MSKLILKPKVIKKKSLGKSRLTIQIRKYNSKGVYDATDDRNNETIWIKHCALPIAYEIIKSALLNSEFIDKDFTVEN